MPMAVVQSRPGKSSESVPGSALHGPCLLSGSPRPRDSDNRGGEPTMLTDLDLQDRLQLSSEAHSQRSAAWNFSG
jgi:hypothetical protein